MLASSAHREYSLFGIKSTYPLGNLTQRLCENKCLHWPQIRDRLSTGDRWVEKPISPKMLDRRPKFDSAFRANTFIFHGLARQPLVPKTIIRTTWTLSFGFWNGGTQASVWTTTFPIGLICSACSSCVFFHGRSFPFRTSSFVYDVNCCLQASISLFHPLISDLP